MPDVILTAERTPHDHNHGGGGHPMRAFVDQPGVWVQRHGDWCRPLHVWLYRGAWRVLCFACPASIRSGNDLWDDGWPTRDAAFDAAMAHCRSCPANAEATGAP